MRHLLAGAVFVALVASCSSEPSSGLSSPTSVAATTQSSSTSDEATTGTAVAETASSVSAAAPSADATFVVEDADGGQWKGRILAAFEGVVNPRVAPRATGRACVGVVATLQYVSGADPMFPDIVDVTMAVDDEWYRGRVSSCLLSPTSSRNDPFEVWGALLPGTAVGFNWGFSDYTDEIPDRIEVVVGSSDPATAQHMSVPVTSEIPPLPELPIGEPAEPLLHAATAFSHAFDGGTMSFHSVGASLSALGGGWSCVQVFGIVAPTAKLHQITLAAAPAPTLVAEGVVLEQIADPCVSPTAGWTLTSDEAFVEAGAVPGITWSYIVPDEARLQALMLPNDDGTVATVELDVLDSLPTPPGG